MDVQEQSKIEKQQQMEERTKTIWDETFVLFEMKYTYIWKKKWRNEEKDNIYQQRWDWLGYSA